MNEHKVEWLKNHERNRITALMSNIFANRVHVKQTNERMNQIIFRLKLPFLISLSLALFPFVTLLTSFDVMPAQKHVMFHFFFFKSGYSKSLSCGRYKKMSPVFRRGIVQQRFMKASDVKGKRDLENWTESEEVFKQRKFSVNPINKQWKQFTMNGWKIIRIVKIYKLPLMLNNIMFLIDWSRRIYTTHSVNKMLNVRYVIAFHREWSCGWPPETSFKIQ